VGFGESVIFALILAESPLFSGIGVFYCGNRRSSPREAHSRKKNEIG